MLPIVFDVNAGSVVLVGEGELVERRLALLDAANARVRVLCANPSDGLVRAAGDRLTVRKAEEADLADAALVFGAGLPDVEAGDVARWARHHGALVNIEDVKPLCDFHVPSMVRRGDLTLTISTGGRSPGLARRIRRHLEKLFGAEWAERLEDVSRLRDRWRSDGMPLDEVALKTDAYIDEKGWLS